MSNYQPSTIVLNGIWGRILTGVILLAIGAGASGLVVAFRMSYAATAQAADIQDHENRLRVVESDLSQMRTGIQVLLERTAPRR